MHAAMTGGFLFLPFTGQTKLGKNHLYGPCEGLSFSRRLPPVSCLKSRAFPLSSSRYAPFLLCLKPSGPLT
jgi:hypothetical protein